MFGKDTTIFELLRREHRELEQRYEALRQAIDSPSCSDRIGAFIRDLRNHEVIEERALGQTLAARAPDAPVVQKLDRAREQMDDAMQALLDASDPTARRAAMTELGAQMRAHFELEEEAVFPATHFLFSPHAERAMLERFTRLRKDRPMGEPS